MSGKKSKTIRKNIYGSYKKHVEAEKVTLWQYIKAFLSRKRPWKELKLAWVHRKWWNSLGTIQPYRLREYFKTRSNSLRNKGLRLQYLMVKKALKMEKNHGRG